MRHYDLDLRYSPPDPAPAPLVGHLDAVATIDLVARQDLDRFNLDLRGMDVQSVTVNGKPATENDPPAAGEQVEGAAYWRVQDDAARVWELTIQPRPKLKSGERATVVIGYSGDTTQPRDIEGVLYGWVTTRDGAMVVGEPDGNMTWYPVSDHPTDKATYTFEITVPEGKVAVANGLQPREAVTQDGWTTWYWDAPDAQASYLTTASVGDYELLFSETADGLPLVDAVDDGVTGRQRETTDASLLRQREMIASSSPGSGRTRSIRTVRSSTTTPSATPWRRRRGRSLSRRTRARWLTSWRTSGSATPSAPDGGRTSG